LVLPHLSHKPLRRGRERRGEGERGRRGAGEREKREGESGSGRREERERIINR
jgi:hypothetical protein